MHFNIIDAVQIKSILKLISHEFCFIREITLDFHLLGINHWTSWHASFNLNQGISIPQQYSVFWGHLHVSILYRVGETEKDRERVREGCWVNTAPSKRAHSWQTILHSAAIYNSSGFLLTPVFTGVFIVTSPDSKLTAEHSAHTHCTISIRVQFSLSSVDIRLNQTIMSIMLRGDRPTLFTTHNSSTLLEIFHSSVTQIRADLEHSLWSLYI